MKKIILLSILIVNGLLLHAQAIVLTGYDNKENWSEAEKEALKKIPPPSFKFPTPYALFKSDNTEMTWQYLAQAKISGFMYNVREYSTPKEVDKAVACAYSVFGLANHAEAFSNAFGYSKDPETLATIFSIYKSKAYHDLLYTWLEPSISAAWATLEPRFKDTFREMLSYVINYLQTLDIEKESKHFKANEESFAYVDASGISSPYRKGAAWCFRRIHAGHMDKDYLLTWCFKIQKEIVDK